MIFSKRIIWGIGMMALLARPGALQADIGNPAPDFKEVYNLIRDHLAGETESDLDKAAVEGLLKQLHSKVSLVGKTSTTNIESDRPLLALSVVYEGPIAYIRVGHVDDGLAGKVTDALKELGTTNHLKGVVLDLRFADGHDYSAAVGVANIFLNKEMPVLDWGNGFVQSKAKDDAITLPLAVLVNDKTAAAGEALAAILRKSAQALIIGSNTAGEATMDQVFTLKNGQSLRIATAAIKLGDGEALTAKGLTPDIAVTINHEEEKVYFGDPYKEIPRPTTTIAGISVPGTNSNGTNRVSRARPTEADLIRDRKLNPGREVEYSVQPGREQEVEKPVIRDPVLGRALDLIKGISVMKATRPS